MALQYTNVVAPLSRRHTSPSSAAPQRHTAHPNCFSASPNQSPHYLRGQCVVDKDVGSCLVGPKGPDGAGCEEVPVVLCLEELANLLPMKHGQEVVQLVVM